MLLQVRRRIIIYDLRLMVEFTDDPLDMLYNHFGIFQILI